MDKGKEILILNIDDVLPNRFQPRIKFNEKNILELADSIREHGVIQPIVVRKISDKYEIIAGERRYKASILAGKTTIPAIVTNFNDKESAEVALLENVQRQDLTPIEEAISYKKILDMGYITQTELAEKLGKTQSTIANKLRLLNLNEDVQEALLEGKISERHARSLLKLKANDQSKLLEKIIEERMTVRKTDEEIKKILENPQLNEINEIKNESDQLNNDFEIIDIEEDKKIEGEENMNQNNNFNPFMDNTQSQSVANPFMNSNQLEVGSNQINNNSSMVNISSDEENNDAGTQKNKFFNIYEANENSNQFVEDLESKEVNMNFEQPEQNLNSTFNFNPVDTSILNSDNNNAQPEPPSNPFMNSVQSEVQPQPVVSNVQPEVAPNPFMNNVQSEVQPQPVVSNVQPEVAPNPFINNVQSEVHPQSVVSNVQPEVAPNPFMNNVQSEVQPQPVVSNVQPEVAPNPFMNNVQSEIQPQPVVSNVQPEVAPNPFMNNVQSEVQPQPVVSNVQSEVQPQPVVSNVQPKVAPNPFMNNVQSEVPTNPIINSNPVDQDLVNSQLRPYTLDDEEEFVNQSNIEMQSPNPFAKNEYTINQEPPTIVQNTVQNTVHQADLKTVINTIRDCSATIEKYGYVVETEEIDFEDSYQVIFKIQK